MKPLSRLGLNATLRMPMRIAAVVLAALIWLLPVVGAPASGAAPPAPTQPITLSFDHLSTGFELDGVHRDLPCESCHLNAVFKGTPRDCGTCHITGSVYNATPKNQTHIQSTNACAACHNTISFRPDVHFDHANVLGSCVSCHNNVIAQGEGPTHPQTSEQCQACHTVMSWNPPKVVDHTQIPLSVAGFCIVCHNGVAAIGQNKGHIKTSLECGDCHLTTSWMGAAFDHTGIKTGCYSCHNGVKAVGKQGSHMPTTNVCEDCHTTGIGTASPSWVPSGFDHRQMTVQTCATCHNGTVRISSGYVSGSPSNHVPLVPTAPDCGFCHGNNPAAETWTVLATSIAGLHTGVDTANCLVCHSSQTFAGVPAPYTPMQVTGISPTKKTPLAPPHIPLPPQTDCSICHGPAYNAGGFGPATAMNVTTHKAVTTTCDTCHDKGKAFYTGSGTPLQTRPKDHINSTDPAMATGDCSQCHETADWISTVLPAGHMPNPGKQSCVQCHASAPGDYTPATLAGLPALHAGVTGNCGQCHGNDVSALTWFNNFTPKDALLTPTHIPYLTGTDCSACHATNYVAGGFGQTVMNAAKHAFVPATSCDTCHGVSSAAAFYPGAALNLQIRPTDATHSSGPGLTSDCSACHTPANWNSNALPAGHMPNPGNQACSVCHTAIGTTEASYATLASVAVLHTGVTGNCGQCHGSDSTALTWYNNYTPKDAILTPAPHIPYLAGSDCSSCHSANYVTGGFASTMMSAAKHAFVPTACDTCHGVSTTTAFYPGAALNLQIRPTDATHSSGQALTGDCSGCHNTTNWNSNALPAGHMPNPGNQACSVCHTAIGSTQASYATLASVAVLHTGITGNCAQCHGDYVNALTWYNNFTPKDGILSPSPHIPYIQGTDCSSCHATNYVTGGFGATTMNAAKHAFVPATACDTCHGVSTTTAFYPGAALNLQIRPTDATHSSGAGLTSDCSACHTPASWNSNALPSGHMPNPGNQACTVCHIAIGTTQASYATLASVAVLHTGISGNCAQCHGDYVNALTWYNNFTPKDGILSPSPHIPYIQGTDCSGCHTTNYVTGGFGATTMNAAKHAFVPATACDTCHGVSTTTAFYPGAALNLQIRPTDGTHSSGAGLTSDCSACHTPASWNSNALPAGHMPNPGNQACSVCHTAIGTTQASYATLASVAVLHTGISGNCAQCHGDYVNALTWFNNFTPKDGILSPSPHIPYIQGTDCSGCHAANYVTGGFGATTMNAAKHAFVPTTSCDTCHGVSSTTAFYPGAALNLEIRPTDATHSSGAGLTNDCSACHTPANWTSNALPAGHMPNPASQACSVCHTAIGTTQASYATLASIPVLHTGITTNCGLCHGSYSAQLTWFNNFTPKSGYQLNPPHIPYQNGVDCANCHATNYVTNGFGQTTMSAAKHAFVPTTCDTCHGVASTAAFYPGAALNLQIRPTDATHSSGQAQSGDCSGCHNVNSWTTTVLPQGHMPNVAGQPCQTCHVGYPGTPPSVASLAPLATLHTGITNSCGECHGAATLLPWYNNYNSVIYAGKLGTHIPAFTGEDCSACHTPNYVTGGFGGMVMTPATHAGVGTTCDNCHGVTSATTFYPGAALNLQIRPTDGTHSSGTMLTGDCSGCHNTTNWTSNTLPAGHMPNPASQACSVCHTAIGNTLASYATLASIPILHTGITNSCAQCHGDTTTTLTFYNNNDNPKSGLLSPVHIPIPAGTDCTGCHGTNYAVGGFANTAMNSAKHSYVTNACDTCHGVTNSASFYPGAGLNLQVRPTDGTHSSGTMLTGDCSGCHNTTDWTSNQLPAGHMPNPGNQTCSVCHTAIGSTLASYATLASVAVLHTGITGNCAQCHGDTTNTLTFYNNNDNPKSGLLSPVHIPILSGSDCTTCHGTNYTVGGFANTTMTSAKHAYVTTSCDTCHGVTNAAAFYPGAALNLQLRPTDGSHSTGTMATGDCSGCHNTTNWSSTQLPAGHMPNPASVACATCHIAIGSTLASYATLASIPVLHTGITSNCAQCHGDTTNTLTFYNNNDNPKSGLLSPVHIPILSGTDCVTCHGTNYAVGGFANTTMSAARHAYVTTTCDTCHGVTNSASFYPGAALNLQVRPTDGSHSSGTMATGDCSGCHNTTNWASNQLPAGHMPNPGNVACTTCHTAIGSTLSSYATLASIAVLHTNITSGCAACHGDTTTTLTFYNNNDNPKSGVLSPVHIPILSGTDCSTCHGTNYVAGGFANTAMSAAKHAYVTTTCDTCHGVTNSASFYPGAGLNLQVRPTDGTHSSGTMLTGDCGGCHNTTDWTSNSLPAGHMPNPAGQACSVCHTAIGSSLSSYATLASISVLHTGITSNCAQCHGDTTTTLTFYNNNDNPKSGVLSPVHIPILSGTDCISCHTINYVAGGFGSTTMSSAKHAYVSKTCDTCHGVSNSASFYPGAGLNLQIRPTDATHSSGTGLTGDCSGCHTTADWSSTALPANHMPNPAGTACATCHIAIPTYTTLASNTVLHTGITSGCKTCHAAPNATAPVYANNFTPKDAILTPPHIPTSTTPCEDCHTATNFTSFSGTTMTSAKHTSMFTVISATNCDVCHGVSSTAAFYPGSSLNLQIRPGDHNSGNKKTEDCSACHSTGKWDDAQKRPASKTTVSLVAKAGVTARAATVTPSIGAAAAGRVGARGNIAAQAAAAEAASARLAAGSNALATTGSGATTALGTDVAANALKAQSAAVSHLGITNNCASCHNGTLATGKGATHVASNSQCENCHTTLAWLPARFDHRGVTAACETCHNGVTAVGKPTQHVKSGEDCGACHGTIAWLPATFSHAGVTATCQSCHNGVIAIGKQVGHAVTTKDCGTCHNTLSWTIATSTPAPLKPLLRKPTIASPSRGAPGGSGPIP